MAHRCLPPELTAEAASRADVYKKTPEVTLSLRRRAQRFTNTRFNDRTAFPTEVRRSGNSSRDAEAVWGGKKHF